jgi:hypothetical protein
MPAAQMSPFCSQHTVVTRVIIVVKSLSEEQPSVEMIFEPCPPPVQQATDSLSLALSAMHLASFHAPARHVQAGPQLACQSLQTVAVHIATQFSFTLPLGSPLAQFV